MALVGPEGDAQQYDVEHTHNGNHSNTWDTGDSSGFQPVLARRERCNPEDPCDQQDTEQSKVHTPEPVCECFV